MVNLRFKSIESCKCNIMCAIQDLDNVHSRTVLSDKFVDTVINSLSRSIQLINNKLTLL